MYVGLTFLVVAAIPIVHSKVILDEDMFLYWRRSEPSPCTPFTTHMVDCNKCVCSADGVSYCTRMACFMKDHQSVEKENASEEGGKDGDKSSPKNIIFPFTSKQTKGNIDVAKGISSPLDQQDAIS